MPFILAIVGFFWTRWVMRRVTDDGWCHRLVLAAYTLAIVMTMVLYYGSLHEWFAWSRQPGNDGGFWVFAEDAQYLHHLARKLVEEWQASGFFVPGRGVLNRWYLLYVAGLYQLFGIHPLHVMVINAWWLSGMATAAVIILRHCGAHVWVMRVGVGLVVLWPSLQLWSSQLMKDIPVLACILLGLAGLVSMMNVPGPMGRRLIGLMLVTGILGLLREFTSLALVITTVGVVFIRMVSAAQTRTFHVWKSSAMLFMVIPLSYVLARHVDHHVGHEALTSPMVGSSSWQGRSAPWTVEGDPARWNLHQGLDPTTLAKSLQDLREGFISTGGSSLVDHDIRLETPREIATYLPRGLLTGLFAPFPWTWHEVGGRTGRLRMLAVLEMTVFWLLFIGAMIRIGTLRNYRWSAIAPVLVFSLLLFIPMSLTVANLGTLFRLRLQFLIPFMLVLVLTEPWESYRAFASLMFSRSVASGRAR